MTCCRTRSSRVVAAVAMLPVLLLSACGNRLSHDEIVRAASGGGSAAGSGTGGAGSTSGGAAVASSGGTDVGSAGSSGAPAVGSTGSGAGATSGSGTGGTGTTSAATGGTGGAAADGGGAAATGAPVILGQVGTFSGLVGGSEGTAQAMTTAWVKWTNAHGGLAGHPIKFYTYDDGGSASKAQSVIKDLVENKHAVAIVGGFLPLTVQSVAPYADQHKIPVIGGDVTSPDWNQHPYLFPMGGSAEAVVVNLAQAMAGRGQKKAAAFYCAESASCAASVGTLQKGADKFGVDVVYKAQVSLASPDFTAQCSQASNAGAQAIFMSTGGDAIQRAARDCRKIPGFKPSFYTTALAVNESQASDPNLDGLSISSDVFPWMQSATPAERDYQAAIRQYVPNLTPAGANAQAWTSGQLLVAGVKALGAAAQSQPLTSALIAQGLWKLNGETMGGLAPKLHFLEGKPAPNVTCTYSAQIKGGKWIAPVGDKLLCY
jgi:branched-chain amino acid transport system substrate-binding protein